MPDLLVRLYDLPAPSAPLPDGITIKRAMTANQSKVLRFVRGQFGEGWADECGACFANKPVSCFIAVREKCEIVGFACYETTWKGFFGPTGVLREQRGAGIGTHLLLCALHGLREMGYAYAVIGGARDAIPFYQKTVGASVIAGSELSVYQNLIGWPKEGPPCPPGASAPERKYNHEHDVE